VKPCPLRREALARSAANLSTCPRWRPTQGAGPLEAPFADARPDGSPNFEVELGGNRLCSRGRQQKGSKRAVVVLASDANFPRGTSCSRINTAIARPPSRTKSLSKWPVTPEVAGSSPGGAGVATDRRAAEVDRHGPSVTAGSRAHNERRPPIDQLERSRPQELVGQGRCDLRAPDQVYAPTRVADLDDRADGLVTSGRLRLETMERSWNKEGATVCSRHLTLSAPGRN